MANDKVNVADATRIGEDMLSSFQNSLPEGFHKPIRAQVHTMEVMKKGVMIGDKTAYNMEKLYGRLLVISNKRNLSLAYVSYVFGFELAPLPAALFDEFGFLRKTSKSSIVKKIIVPFTGTTPVDIQLVDGNELFYHITWPKQGSAIVLYDNLVEKATQEFPVMVVFDRYVDGSLKSHERVRRAQGVMPGEFLITSDSPLPCRETVMKNSENKKRLIDTICYHNVKESPHNMHLIGDKQNTFGHEEADVTIISYLFLLIQTGDVHHIQVRTDDTDILLLLIYFYWNQQPDVQISMMKFDDSVIDINACARRLGSKCNQLLAMHALTGCDSTSYPFNKGKTTGLNVVQKYDLNDLTCFGEENATKEEVISSGNKFFSHMYSSSVPTEMKLLRHSIFSRCKNTPEIKTLPPTDEALAQHSLRCHIQVMIWKAALNERPPDMDITDFGWYMKEGIPHPVTGVAEVAPPELLKTVACSCKSLNRRCSTDICSCKGGGLSCTTYCKCEGGPECHNEHTIRDNDEDDNMEFEEYNETDSSDDENN